MFEKSLVCGVGDSIGSSVRGKNGNKKLSYSTWAGMILRCYDNAYQEKHPSYKGCTVAKEWHSFSNFETFFDENYIEGHQLDKDILYPGNKIYSKDNCRFVPSYINSLLSVPKVNKALPLGVTRSGNKFLVRVSILGKKKKVGLFCDPIEAFQAYKIAKENHVKAIAKRSFLLGDIPIEIYESLVVFKVECGIYDKLKSFSVEES